MSDPLPLVGRLRDHADVLEAVSPSVAFKPGGAALKLVIANLREAAAALEANTVLLLAAEALASRRTCQCPADEFVSEHRYACPIAIALEIRALRLTARPEVTP